MNVFNVMHMDIVENAYNALMRVTHDVQNNIDIVVGVHVSPIVIGLA